MGYNGKYVTASTYPGSVYRRCPDLSKSRKDLGYSPKVSWERGLEKTVSWYKAFFESGKSMYGGGFRPPEELSFKP